MASPVGRPRIFDVQAAIRTAQAIFWRNGYEATSLAALAEAIGVHKPSLYAAYGDKRALYLQAYDAYQRDAAMLVASALSAPRLRDALTTFFASDLDLFTGETGVGCFMLTTALPLAGTDPEIADRVRAALAGLRSAVVERLKIAETQGEMAAQMQIETAADLFLSTHIALANRARSGEVRETLQESAQRLIDVICSEKCPLTENSA
jgi:TetR/AcrR family transcriptional regulator, copper-responsive repressor